MKKILLVGGVAFALGLFLIVSDFSINPGNMETGMRSVDLTDMPGNRIIDLHETRVGNQYKESTDIATLAKSVSDTQWKETHIALEKTISENSVQKDITFEYHSEMPTPPQSVLDRFDEKFENPTTRKIPATQNSENEIDPFDDESINVITYLDNEKKTSNKTTR